MIWYLTTAGVLVAAHPDTTNPDIAASVVDEARAGDGWVNLAYGHVRYEHVVAVVDSKEQGVARSGPLVARIEAKRSRRG